MLFLLYHYFNAREIYNAIRVFIAGYVWMTGYGNFMYYYHYKDFCLGRCATFFCAYAVLERSHYLFLSKPSTAHLERDPRHFPNVNMLSRRVKKWGLLATSC